MHPDVLEDDQNDQRVAEYGQEGDGPVQDGQQTDHPVRLIKVHHARHVTGGVGGRVLGGGLYQHHLLLEAAACGAAVSHGVV